MLHISFLSVRQQWHYMSNTRLQFTLQQNILLKTDKIVLSGKKKESNIAQLK